MELWYCEDESGAVVVRSSRRPKTAIAIAPHPDVRILEKIEEQGPADDLPVVTIVINETLRSTVEAADAAAQSAKEAEEAEELAIANKRGRREFGLRIVDIIQIKNENNGITTTQTIAFMQMTEVQNIKLLLESGAIESAKEVLNSLDSAFFSNANVVITATDRDDIVSKIDDYLGL